MVITLAQAIAWGVSGLLGVRHDEPVAHRDLEHAHWDPVTRTWFTHGESAVPAHLSETALAAAPPLGSVGSAGSSPSTAHRARSLGHAPTR